MFDGNADEGFLVGYSVSSKAFRVFNSRTKIVQEKLHINFLENQPNVVGSGPTWLFDIDTLTQSINFNQLLQGINLILVQVSKIILIQVKVNAASAPVTAVGPNPTNSTNIFNAAGPSDTNVSPSFEIGKKSPFVDPSQYSDDPNMPALEDIIYSDDEEDVGAGADFSNLETSITIRSMARTVKEQGGLTQINDEDFHTSNDEDDVYIEATPLALKDLVVDYQIHNEHNQPYYKIIRADETHQLFLSFITLLKNFDREDLEMLWKPVQERFQSSDPKNFSNDFLLNTLKIMFEKPNVEASIWRDQRGRYGLEKVKSWKLFESYGVTS
nr:retrovirus-related Pol polyprotein from transposon TNT 1-94 [Tanacetum cinerariifolium]